MAAEKPEASPFPIGNLVAILLLVAGVVVNKLPLESARPAGDDPTGRQFAGLQDITVRLWQDPFMAVEKSRAQRNGDAGHKIDFVAEKIKNQVEKDDVLTVLGVSVFGSPYAEDQESRRKTRYAVVSALGAAAYQPWDAEKIGLIRTNDKVDVNAGPPRLIPFEGYTDANNNHRHVLVVWLDETHYIDKPLQSYAALRDTVDRLAGKNARLQIIGPVSSYTISTLAKQVCTKEKDNVAINNGAAPSAANGESDIAKFQRIQFFSSGATVRLKSLDDVSTAGPADHMVPVGDQRMETCESMRSHLLRVTNTDDQLANVVVKELANRGVKPGEHSGRTGEIAHVAFVYEWDNLFSRIWLDEFVTAAQSGAAVSSAEHATKRPIPPWMSTARFMRGLDGAEAHKPADAKAGGNGATNGHKAAPAKPAARTDDHADGTGQYDYLLRLADALRIQDKKLREPNDEKTGMGAIRAIGVISNDPYDKLLVLQALRPHFPDAIFFTNDLDARLLQKEQYKWARNVLVASAFGLQLEPALQQGTAPFRDTYQTGTFLATRLALATDENTNFATLRQCVEARVAPARLFEIGRTFAADISPHAGSSVATSAASAASACAKIPLLSNTSFDGAPSAVHLKMNDIFSFPGKKIMQWVLLLALALLLVALFSRIVQCSIRGKMHYLKTAYRARPRSVRAVAGALLIAFAALAWKVKQAVGESVLGVGEPFVLFEGISM